MVGAFAPVTGVVTDGGVFLPSEHRDHGAVEIEDQPGSAAGKVNESWQQSVVDSM
jgi:hypothetical protein